MDETPKAIVYSGERFVEVTQASTTLQDICAAFEVPYRSGVFIRERASQRVTATLPFEEIIHASNTADEESPILVLDLCVQVDDLERAEGEVTAAVQQLVKLGAVELLTDDSKQRLAEQEAYDPAAAPGLLRRAMYPPSAYSPFRSGRDPIVAFENKHTRMHAAAGGELAKESGPYVSTLDTYHIGDAAPIGAYPHLCPLTAEESNAVWGAQSADVSAQ